MVWCAWTREIAREYSLQANRKGFSAFYNTPPCAKKTQELLNLIERRKLLHFIGHKKTREANKLAGFLNLFARL